MFWLLAARRSRKHGTKDKRLQDEDSVRETVLDR
jgi:hypothetical protein